MRNSLWSGLSVLLLASACNVTTTGDRGRVTFTPDDCGQPFCSLGLDLAAGTSMEVEVDPIDGTVAHPTLIAEDARVAVVVPVATAGAWRWRAIGVDGGHTHLLAVDARGLEIDRTDLVVARPSELGLELESGPAVEHAAQPPGVEVWTLTAASRVVFHIRPLDAFGGEMMGKLDLSADLDVALFQSLESTARLGEGKLALRPMLPGDYSASFYGPQGLVLDVALLVR